MEKSYADFLSGLFDRKLDNDMNVIKKDKIIIKNPSPLIEKIIQKNETKLGRVKQDIENYVFLCQRSQISSASLVSVNTLLRQGQAILEELTSHFGQYKNLIGTVTYYLDQLKTRQRELLQPKIDIMTTSRACEILGIPEHPFPTADVIQTAFRRKTSLYHPDRNPSPEASEKMKELNTARDYLMRYIK